MLFAVDVVQHGRDRGRASGEEHVVGVGAAHSGPQDHARSTANVDLADADGVVLRVD